MPTVVTTKDCTALSDAELAEMADLCAERPPGFDIGFLSKQREEWVLVTHAREGSKLRGYSFCTLERIGGTPSLLVGLASVDRTAKADSVLRTIMADQYRRALLAFPDEDVLLGTRLLAPEGFRAFAGLVDVVPSPGHKPTGEERAWARRLAKRFGCEGRLDDRAFVLKGDRSPAGGLDFLAAKVKLPEGVEQLFGELDSDGGDRLVAFGWAMAEDLAGGKLGR
ncbi:MAG TPA: hypothetical protein VMU76_05130 [Acidimicrobiales bacterium]|nr:hypothetical protein [Acidimicrobiales bacterium]